MTAQQTVGYYGMRGWSTRKEIKKILSPHLVGVPLLTDDIQPGVVGNYEPFHGVGAETAEKLLNVLPERNLRDRQNCSPVAEELLHAAVENAGQVDLIGYAIGPARQDERVTFEGFVYYGHPEFKVADFHDVTCECNELWECLKKELNLSSALDRPDEIRALRPSWNPSREGWWLWWD
ncbi:hypothetical protein [uncultured Actinomyces sp.]|uniref:hypothetical protein n=1 Tax=uncultured Actinomyces sp. TaxID=249061 RepID=UPI0026152706|nr:hypothetical protein [uncultured Actinomyces sp.]